MKTVTANTKAWLASHNDYTTPQDLMEGNFSGLCYSGADMTSVGWTLVGEAEITVTIPDERTLIDNKVEALRKEAANIRAEATAKVTQIESQIQNLLAISFDGVVSE